MLSATNIAVVVLEENEYVVEDEMNISLPDKVPIHIRGTETLCPCPARSGDTAMGGVNPTGAVLS